MPKLSALVLTGALLTGALLTAACTSSTSGGGHLGGPTVTVVCEAASGDGAQDKSALTKRLDTLGADIVSIKAAAANVTMKVRGVKATQVTQICASSTLAIRPVVAPTTGACSAPDRTAAPSASVQACDSEGKRYRFGPAIVSGADITDADAIAPTVNGAGWTVAITLSPTASTAFGRFTTTHNVGSTSAPTSAHDCSATTVPCADYLGFLVGGKAVSVPVTQSAITGGMIQIAGAFTRQSTRQLATQLKSGPLPVPLTLVSAK